MKRTRSTLNNLSSVSKRNERSSGHCQYVIHSLCSVPCSPVRYLDAAWPRRHRVSDAVHRAIITCGPARPGPPGAAAVDRRAADEAPGRTDDLAQHTLYSAFLLGV